MEKMLRPMLRTSGASMFGLQLGQGLGHLATEVVGATDIGLPLSEPGHVALLPTNIKAFGEGLEQSSADVTLYLALRECARQRLFASAGWLRSQMLALVEQYASGITIDTSALEQAVGQARCQQSRGADLIARRWPVRAAEDARAAGHLGAAGNHAGARRRLGGRGGHSGDRPVDARRPLLWPRPCAGLAPPEVRPRRRSPRWWDLSCGHAGCAMPPTCGRRCATPAASMVETPSGRIRTWCRHRPILTIRWALSPGRRAPRARQNADIDSALEELLKGESTEGDENPSS